MRDVNYQKEPKRSWFNVFVLENAALPHPKRQKLAHEASLNLNPIHSQEPNTSSPINISEDELTEIIRRGYRLSTANHYIV